jgi:hypothetical protein
MVYYVFFGVNSNSLNGLFSIIGFMIVLTRISDVLVLKEHEINEALE